LLTVDNRTNYRAELVPCWNADGHEVVLAVIKATYSVDHQGNVDVDAEQAPIRFADKHFGEPGQSSVRYESDIALHKPAADVIVNATAHSPAGRSVEQLPIGARVGTAVKRLVVTGDRFWNGLGATAPVPFAQMPITYERAIGGRENPVGRSWSDGSRPTGEPLLPNVELLDQRIHRRSDRPKPGGLGSVARNWWPRAQYAGTYDGAWLEERMPFLPKDFDHRFFQCAADGMTIPYPTGGEPVDLVNLAPTGPLRFALRVPRVTLLLRYDRRLGEASPVADTVLIEPDIARVEVTLRAQIPCDGNALRLREVLVTEAGETIKRAFLKGKRILSRKRRTI
jgi:hypothetical protein